MEKTKKALPADQHLRERLIKLQKKLEIKYRTDTMFKFDIEAS